MVRVKLIKPVDENSKKPSLISNNDRLLKPCLYTYQRRSSPDPCSKIVKLITCVVADETLDGRGVLRVRDSELLCDPRRGISIFHERVFDKAVLKSRQPISILLRSN
jgi:hypothetical protein